MSFSLIQLEIYKPIIPEVGIQKVKREPVGNRVKSDPDLPWKTIRLN